jgi:hypothetical protein
MRSKEEINFKALNDEKKIAELEKIKRGYPITSGEIKYINKQIEYIKNN